MREMKRSEIEWIRDIPTPWKVMPNKYLMYKVKDICPVYGGEDILSLTMKGVIVRDLDAGGKMPASFDGYQRLEAGNLLMCLFDIDVTPRCVGLIKQSGLSSPAYSQFVLKEGADAAYYCYYYTMLDNDKTLLHLAKNLRHSLTEDQLGAVPTVVPPIDEQKKIAAFLDVKCAEIDALIADVQTQIDTLEQYKRSSITEAVTRGIRKDFEVEDSRVFYMGPINKKWALSKIGYICTKLSHAFQPEDTALICSNKGKVLVRDSGLTGIMVSEDNAMQGIRKGDIAIHGMDTWHGAVALSEMDGKITRVVHVCDSTEDKRFVVYWLQHLAFQGVYKLISNGVRGNTSDFRSWDKVSDIYIPIPTRQEQAEICDYLDHICKEVDAIAEIKKNQLTVLEAYKKSLIFEYVTGKKEVPAPITAVMLDPNVILLGKLPKLLSKQKGKIYNQKVLYLLNTYLGLNLDVQYYRYKHGPYDIMLDSYIDTLVENGWCVKSVNNGAENLDIGPNYGAFEEKYGSCFSEYNTEINSLIQFVQPMKRSQIERVATLFAVWNDMILDGNSTPTDAEIVSEVMSGWTENKANFAYDTWVSTLNKMRSNGVVPKGQGLHTLPKEC